MGRHVTRNGGRPAVAAMAAGCVKKQTLGGVRGTSLQLTDAPL